MKNCLLLLALFLQNWPAFAQDSACDAAPRSFYVAGASKVATLSSDPPRVWLWDNNSRFSLFDFRLDSLTSFSLSSSSSLPPQQDPFEKEKWWVVEGGYISQIDAQSLQHSEFGLANGYANQFFFDEKTVWVGATSGLFAFDRASQKFGLVGRSPNQKVLKIERGPSGKLLVWMQSPNDRNRPTTLFSYDPATACWGVEEQLWGISVDSISHWFSAGGRSMVIQKKGPVMLVDSLGKARVAAARSAPDSLGGWVSFGEPIFIKSNDWSALEGSVLWTVNASIGRSMVERVDLKTSQRIRWRLTYDEYRRFQIAGSPGEIWFSDEEILGCFSQKTGLKQLWRRPRPGKTLRSIAIDTDQIFLLFDDSLTVVGKGFFQNRPPDWHVFQEQKKAFERACDSIRLNKKEPLAAKQAKIEFLKSRFPVESEPDFQKRTTDAMALVSVEFSRENVRVLFDERLGADWARSTFADWSRRLALRTDWDELEFLVNNSPPAIRSDYQEAWDTLQLHLQKMRDLDKKDLPADERLWAKSVEMWPIICTRFFSSGGWGEWWSGRGPNLVDSFYLRILAEFPNSERADDADFERTCLRLSRDSDVGRDRSGNCKALEAFLRRWPQTSLLPKVNWLLIDNADLRTPEGARAAMRMILETEKMGGRPDVRHYSYYNLIWRVTSTVFFFDVKLVASLKKAPLHVGEPVEIEVLFQNTGEFELPLHSFYPDAMVTEFSVFVRENFTDKNCVRPLAFVENEDSEREPAASGERTIKPGEKLTVTLDLTKAVKSSSPSRETGHFVFDHAGEFEAQLASLSMPQLVVPVVKFRIVD